ncbi:MAG TPA: hypothetical protein VGB39_07310 [Sphingomicrobium sp.]
MKRPALFATLLVLSVGSPAVRASSQSAFLPKGAKIEGSGFATIERAPPVAYPDEPPPAENWPGEERWYAQVHGLSAAEVRRRHREQQALRPEFERLIGLLRVREAGNFTAPRIVQKPHWAFVLYFRRDPERTLAKYTRHPRIMAALARYSPEQLTTLARPWIDRFVARKLAAGRGIDATYGVAEIMLNVTEEEYREIAARELWGPVPDAVVLQFSAPLHHASVDERAKPFLRIFAQNSRSTTRQPEAGFLGRITMRDGCLYSGKALAYFHRETGIGIDDQGYLALTDRRTGKNKGRIGEWFTWAGPNRFSEDMPMVRELRQRCGNAPIDHVGNPQSAAQFRVSQRAWTIDDIAKRRRISRQRAWERVKQCWAKADAAAPSAPPDDLVNCN